MSISWLSERRRKPDSLKVLDPERPIREATFATQKGVSLLLVLSVAQPTCGFYGTQPSAIVYAIPEFT
jgi:hypothetical protein